jgi:hypothetical protein
MGAVLALVSMQSKQINFAEQYEHGPVDRNANTSELAKASIAISVGRRVSIRE